MIIGKSTLLVLACLWCFACSRSPQITTEAVDNPSGQGARLPNVSSHQDDLLLSWVEQTQDGPTPIHALRYAKRHRDGTWSPIRQVASGPNWFVNWADFPSMYAHIDGSLSAHWLVRSGDSTYAYDVVTSQSYDGQTWSAPWTPHFDGTKTEHGFVSFYAQRDNPALVWLDGRNTASSQHDHADHAKNAESIPADAPSMSLRTRLLPEATTKDAQPTSRLLDDRVCDCCQTAAATSDSGAVVFYRDRSATEVRDISYVHFDAVSNTWTAPKPLHADGWRITGCPVNGPQADALGNQVVVAWFTAAPTPRVQIAVSIDGGTDFGEPVIVSDQSPIGRVDLVVLNDRSVLISWLEQTHGDQAQLKVAWYSEHLTHLARTVVANVPSERRSGFARMASVSDNAALVTWTSRSSPSLEALHTPADQPSSRVSTALIKVSGAR